MREAFLKELETNAVTVKSYDLKLEDVVLVKILSLSSCLL